VRPCEAAPLMRIPFGHPGLGAVSSCVTIIRPRLRPGTAGLPLRGASPYNQRRMMLESAPRFSDKIML